MSLCLHLEDDVSAILRGYDKDEKVIMAKTEYRTLGPSTSLKKVDMAASRRIFVDGEETMLTREQKKEKVNVEMAIRDKAIQLKKDMLKAGKTRRDVLKERKKGIPT
jgi:hypothetical protein